MKTAWMTVIAAGVLGATGAQAATITNGSFEANNVGGNYGAAFYPGSTGISGWTVVGDNADHDVALLSNSAYGLNTPFGTTFLDLTGYSDQPVYSGVQQTISTVKNQTYTLTFWLGADTNSAIYAGPVAVQINAGRNSGSVTNTGTVTQTAGTTVWTQETFAFTAGSTSLQLQILGLTSTGGQFIGLDNISIADAGTPGAVPEPASWAMIIGGIGAVGAAMRRRKTSVAFA